MAHDSNGHIYVDTQNGVGIGIQEVNTVLGAGSLDLATLCRSPRVNTYAKCKPNGATAVAQQTIAQRQAVNCGIDCSDTSTGCFSADLTALLARAKALFDWQKVTPTICRLLDFDGYEHRASCPYEPVDDIIGNTTGDPTMNVTILVHQNIESGNVQISDLVEALTRKGNDVTEDFQRGLLVRNTAKPSNLAVIAETAGSSQYVFPIDPEVDYAHPVTYDCVFVHYAQNGNTYWAVFYPRTYFQAKMALFYVSVENQTLSFPKAGGTSSLVISGYEWGASWGGKDNPDADIVMSLSPGEGGSTSPSSNVTLTVQPSTYKSLTSTTVTKAITIRAPGQVGTGADFTKTFYVTQVCDLRTGYIALVDANNEDIGREVTLTRLGIDAEKDIRIRADRSWKIADQNTEEGAGIVYKIRGDDSGTYYDGRGEISLGPSSATITTGTGTTKKVTIVNLVLTIPVNHIYEVLFVSVDHDTGLPDGQASFRLIITPTQGQA